MKAASFHPIGWRIDPFLKAVGLSIVRSQNLQNAVFSLSEYALIPLLYLAATPFLVKRLGLDCYGLWMLINSIAGMAAALNFGLGDSTVRFVSMYRGSGETISIIRGIRTACSVSALIALVAGSLLFLCSPLLVNVFQIRSEITILATQSLQIGAALLALQVVESMFKGALQGHERYDLSAMVSVAARMISW